MLDGMTAEEYIYWQAYFSVEPFPEMRADLRTAESLRIAILAASEGKQKPKIQDLLPNWWGDERKQSPAQIKQNFTVANAAIKAGKAAKMKGK